MPLVLWWRRSCVGNDVWCQEFSVKHIIYRGNKFFFLNECVIYKVIRMVILGIAMFSS
ncbi:hypothetical protein CLU79DRAFT_780074, partial [Phycomyces nitens]